jgi:hypothetical protein
MKTESEAGAGGEDLMSYILREVYFERSSV